MYGGSGKIHCTYVYVTPGMNDGPIMLTSNCCTFNSTSSWKAAFSTVSRTYGAKNNLGVSVG